MISSLHDILNPFLLRRRKEEVALDLPKKREYILYAPMLPKQRELYNAILRQELEACLEKNMSQAFSLDIDTFGSQSLPVNRRKKVKYTEVDSSDLSDVDGGQENIDHRSAALKSKKTFIKNLVGRQNLQMTVTQLRKCCNHPYLFHIETENAENPLVHGLPEVVAWSGKMLLLDRLLTALLEKKHKVLIFSQFTSMLNVIEDYLWLIKGLDICRIDGTVALDDRKSEISKFSQANSKYSVFLLSTRAGGLGINLTAADTVIIFDSDW
jgi:ATP-dependent DNA helicase